MSTSQNLTTALFIVETDYTPTNNPEQLLLPTPEYHNND